MGFPSNNQAVNSLGFSLQAVSLVILQVKNKNEKKKILLWPTKTIKRRRTSKPDLNPVVGRPPRGKDNRLFCAF